MNKIFSADRPEKLWIHLQQLVADRAAEEAQIATEYAEQQQKTQQEYQAARKKATDDYTTQKTNLQNKYTAARNDITQRFQSEHSALENEYHRICSDEKKRHKQLKAKETQIHKEARWEASTVFEATKDGPKQRLKVFAKQLTAHRRSLGSLGTQAEVLLKRRWQRLNVPEPDPSEWPDEVVATERFNTLSKEARDQWNELLEQRVGSLFEGGQLFVLLLLFWPFTLAPAGFLIGWASWPIWVPVGLVVGLLLWGALFVWLFRIARHQSTVAYAALRQTLVDAEQAAEHALDDAKERCRKEEEAIAERLRTDKEKADTRLTTTVESSRTQRDETVQKADAHYPPLLTEMVVNREHELQKIEAEHKQTMEQFEKHHQEKTEQREESHAQKVQEQEEHHKRVWNEMAQKWLDGMAQFQKDVDELNEARHTIYFDWRSRDVAEWKPRTDVPEAVPYGELTVDMGQLESGIPADPRLAVDNTQFALPALLPFPERSLLLTATDEGRAVAVETIRSVMLRMLTGVRPGKIRFTVIDPVGLGESFSAFMHLADFDEQAISSRIWTESSHIEQQLFKLTEHMETVIQVYLRNEFETIQQYNEFAGEMAEPYRVLVVANFPANFSESAARRLLSIITSGARCGVYVLMSVDTRLKPPHGFEMSDLQAEMHELMWKKGLFTLKKGSPLLALPLELDTPPEAKPFTDLVRAVGQQIHEIDRVEVPFGFVVPKEEDWWQGNTARELNVPLGRAGAMKLQYLSMGRGTAQHVLIAGKTGSGKSNLLHAIITNVGLWYGPDQVETYLVDFKKGVEFKAYAEKKFPHARVVAIESEREFGLSVLERLDEELKIRGDRFRKIGVQDMPGWRRERPDEPMPRVLLVIDEFQELFIEDDRIAQNAALLLDRLVRQGRAFGMHVLLGSQTLAGAYSLPRATIGQMAVRIALQCSESDAHLILSEENTAARLLTRPGEAIYNDANGLFEGNHPFQIVYLPDQEKAEYLGRLRDFAATRDFRTTPPIVFEGNAAADPRDNWQLGEILASDERPSPVEPPRAWLGSAVAIKEPTSVTFRRQGGSNLLLVGHDEEAAMGVLGTSMVSLAAQTPLQASDDTKHSTFYILDGTRPEAPEAGFWERFGQFLPQPTRLANPRAMPEAVAEVAAECTRRHEEGIDNGPPIYLVIFNLGRFRELRREEDSFRFSSLDDDKPPSPSVQLSQILREGPALGIHVLIWCDTCNTLNRWFERQTIHDIEMRIAFQMSASDSSMLIDTPDAGKLGAHRAILYDEGLGQSEKFRPYRVPDEQWLTEVRSQISSKTEK